MKERELTSDVERSWIVVFEPGEEAMEGLKEFSRRHELTAARLSAVGAFEHATVGYFQIDQQEYSKIQLDEQMEVLSLLGDVVSGPDGVAVHAHVVLGDSKGHAHGGHLLEGRVRPTLEVMVVEAPVHLRRVYDPRFGIALIDPNSDRSMASDDPQEGSHQPDPS